MVASFPHDVHKTKPSNKETCKRRCRFIILPSGRFGHTPLAGLLSGRFWPGPPVVFFCRLSAGAVFLLAASGQARLYPYFAGAESPFAGHHYRAQTFRFFSNDLPFVFSFSAGAVTFVPPTTPGGRFCKNENFSDFFKQKAVLLKRPSFMPERPPATHPKSPPHIISFHSMMRGPRARFSASWVQTSARGPRRGRFFAAVPLRGINGRRLF